jgi:dihydroneopterin aldolase
MLNIYLHKLLFYSYHGVHEEEKVLGGEYEVDLTVNFQPSSLPVKHLDETVNYVTLYSVVKKRMEQPTPLIETIATELATQILEQFHLIEQVEISIKKLHPPIASFQGSVGVSFVLKRQ